MSEIARLKNNPEYMAVIAEMREATATIKRNKWGQKVRPLKGRFGRPPVDNDFANRYAVHGAALLRYVRDHAELRPQFENGIARLAERKTYKLDPDGASPARRSIVLRYNRRMIFLPLAREAIPHYLASVPGADPAFSEHPRRVATAFSAQCVREYLRRFFGNPDHERV